MSKNGGCFIKHFFGKYIKNKYRLLQLIGILIALPYVFVRLNFAKPTLFWFTTFPGGTLFFIGIVLEYIFNKNKKD